MGMMVETEGNKCYKCGGTFGPSQMVGVINIGGQDGDPVHAGNVQQYGLCWDCFLLLYTGQVQEPTPGY